jgi:hypothetical protein
MSQPFSPVRVGRYTLANRLVMAPMTRSRAELNGTPSALAPTYYSQRSSVGLIVTEGTQPSDDGQGYLTTPGIYTDAHVAAGKRCRLPCMPGADASSSSACTWGAPIDEELSLKFSVQVRCFGVRITDPSVLPVQSPGLHGPRLERSRECAKQFRARWRTLYSSSEDTGASSIRTASGEKPVAGYAGDSSKRPRAKSRSPLSRNGSLVL